MRLQDDIDFTTLTWVKQELDDTLKQAQQALEAYVEDTSDKSQMRFCASYLHQVQGTLRMVELYGAAMVVEEMERLALGLLDGQIKQAEDAYTVLMRGMVQLPDYLERLQSGHRDIPIVLLPLLNDLRACRGEKLLSETALFSPDLSAALPVSAAGAKLPTPQPLLAANGGRLRLAFQFGLLKWFKGEDIDGNVTRLIASVDRLRTMCVQLDARRLFWVAGAALEAVLLKSVDASVALKLLIGRVDREIKRLVDAGEPAFSAQPPTELTKGLLYYVAQSTSSAPRVAEVKQVYQLDKLIPSQSELDHARGALSGHNRALLDTVGTAIKEDLLRIKDAFDLYLRTGSTNVEELASQSEALHRVADTLGMLGLGVPRRVVLDQKEVLERIVQGRQSADESVLLDVAGSLLYVESSLDDHIERLGAEQKPEAAAPGGFELPQAEVRKILDATTKEASANIQQAKQDIVAFIESPWDHSKIEQIPRLLDEISGAMRMLNLPDAAELLSGVVRFAEVELLKHRRVPSGDQLDLMADAIASIEFYLEAVKEGRRNRDKILDVTRRSLEALGYWPLPVDGADLSADSDEILEVAPEASDFPRFPDAFATDRVGSPPPTQSPMASEPTAEHDSMGLPDASAIDSMIASSSEVVDIDTLFDSSLGDQVGMGPFVNEPVFADEPSRLPSAASAVIDETVASTSAASADIDVTPLAALDAVDIAPGDNLESLLIGDIAPATEPADIQLSGLRVTTAELEAPGSSSLLSDLDFIDLSSGTQPFDASIRDDTALSLDDLIADVAPKHEHLSLDLGQTDPEFSFEVDARAPAKVDELDLEAPAFTMDLEAPALTMDLEPPVAAADQTVELSVSLPEDSVNVDSAITTFAIPDVGFQAMPSDEIDDEIREVFVEEVEEELNNLNRQYPQWKSDLGDFEKLKPVRRSFHTLKGSGRLVGALAIGEFAWKIENMLNRVLDKTIQPTPAILDLLDNALAALPSMLAGLKGEGRPDPQIGTIMWVSDQLASGQEVWLPKSSPATVAKADKPVAAAGAFDGEIQSAAFEAETDHSMANGDVEPVAVGVGTLSPAIPALEQQVPYEADHHSLLTPSAGSPLDVDPMLMEILSSEITSHVATMRRFLAEAELLASPPPVTEELLRAVHTMNGALSMVDLPVLTRFVGPLEGYLKRLRAQGHEPSFEGVEALRDSANCIEATMHSLENHLTVSSTEFLADRVVALRDGLPAPDHPYQGYGIHDLDEQHPETSARPWYEVDTVESAAADEPARSALSEPAILDIVEEPDVALVFDADNAAGDGAMVSPDADAATVDPVDSFSSWQEEEPNSGAGELATESDLQAGQIAEIIAIPFDEDAFLADDSPAGQTSAQVGEDAGGRAEVAQIEGDLEFSLPTEETIGVEFSAHEQPDGSVPLEVADLQELLSQTSVAPTGSLLNELPVISTESFVNAEVELDRWLSDDSFDPAELAIADEIGELIASGELSSARPDAVSMDDVLALTTPVDDVEAVPLANLDVVAIEVTEAEDEQDDFSTLAKAPGSETGELLSDFAGQSETSSGAIFELASEHDGVEADEAMELAQAALGDNPSVPEFSRVSGDAKEEHLKDAETTQDLRDAVGETAEPEGGDDRDTDPPGALNLPDVDLELLDIFVEEGVDILDHADGMMARLRESPEDRETVAALQRDLHTLKGGARMAGLTPIGDLSHAMESLFEAIAQGDRKATRPAIESLERAFDRLHGMVQRVRARQAIALPENIIARIEMVLEGREAELLSQEVSTPVSVPAVPETKLVAAQTAEAERVAPPPAARPSAKRKTQLDEDEATARAAQQELIRVRADLLDNLVNFAGEVSIYRSRLEAQMGGFRFNLVEFEQTVLRLRDQLRKLEMETEAQILSRFQRETEQSGGTEFDPLELDRFSTLQQLSRALAESVSDLVSIQNLLDDIARQSETLLLQQSRVSSDLQEGLMRTRMVPFESLVPRLRRILRQTATELGKKAQLRVEGTQGEMDRTVLERMTAPFEHMLRNSLAHGIESPDVRRVRGKAEEGAVSIRVSREATEVLIQVVDDGGGMNRDAIRRKAIERGLMNPEAQLSDRDIYQFVLEAGFSTADEVSKVAGRGVGMDVVASEVKQLGGSLELDSDPGQGTRITIRLPFTLAVAQAVLVRLGEATFAIPMTSITGVTRMPRKELDRRLEQKQLEIAYGGETYQIYDLGDLLRSPVNHSLEETQVPMLMSRTGDQRAAIRVSHVIGSKEVVVKSAGAQLSSVPGIFGATIMGDGRVVVILDLAPLVRHGVALRQAPELAAALELLEPLPEPATRRQPLVMVVDDSITMRKVTTRVLERADFDVFTAKDGLDAVEQLQDRLPDVILLDIEMPRMDGYEVATYIRNDHRLKHIPIIMITSRTGEKHRQRAMEIGVDRYLGKPYQESDLLKNVQEALTAGHANVH